MDALVLRLPVLDLAGGAAELWGQGWVREKASQGWVREEAAQSDQGRGKAGSKLAELDGVLLVAPLPRLGADAVGADPAEPRRPPSPSTPAPMRASRWLIEAVVAGSLIGPADGW